MVHLGVVDFTHVASRRTGVIFALGIFTGLLVYGSCSGSRFSLPAINRGHDKKLIVGDAANVLSPRRSVGVEKREPWQDPHTLLKSSVSPELVNSAFGAKEQWDVKKGTRVLLVPHHLVAAKEIASLLSSTRKPSVVYLVAPDHFSRGKTTITEWPDQPEVFEKEHGVTALLPFMERAWPGVEIRPIIVRIDATEDDRTNLAAMILTELDKDPKALLVASVDFSHELPAELADFHDVLARDVVASLADLESDRVELDSPGALSVALKVARILELGNVTIHAHTNSLRLLQATIAQDSTSHLLASFAPGNIRAQEKTTILFLGDMMFDRTVRDRINASKDPLYPFQKIRDSENRFFRGQDLMVGNLEGPATSERRAPVKSIDFAFDPDLPQQLKEIGIDAVSQANNHSLDQGRDGAKESRTLLLNAGLGVFGDEVFDDAQSSTTMIERRGKKIALIGFNTTDNPLDEADAEKTIADARAKANYVIVFMHWGEEYQAKPNDAQISRAHWLIDRGVDAVIGAHPHWMQSIEVYKDRPIAYSLGNFIFDQDWSEETKNGLVVGLEFVSVGAGLAPAHSFALHLYPIKIDASQPRLLTGQERKARLERLAEISDEGLREGIREGVVRMP